MSHMNNHLKKEQPIGVFDSGVGGISVLRELVKIMPNENYIYFGDSKNAPYGTKTLEEVRRLSFKNTASLLEQGAKAIVVACNTATSAAVRLMRERYEQVPDDRISDRMPISIPIVGIEPAVKPAALQKEHARVLVMATPMTVGQEKFHMLMERYQDRATIYPLACPGLMEFVERGDLSSGELHEFLENLLRPYQNKNLDSVVLGCTHYPFVKSAIQEIMGDSVTVFDGGAGTAREMRRRLEAADLLNLSDKKGWVKFESSVVAEEELEAELALCRRLLELEV